MISTFAAANRRIAIALLAASTALASPAQAQKQPAHQPASPAVPGEAPHATLSDPAVVAIPVPLPLPGQLKQFPQAYPPHAAGRSRPTRSSPAPRDRVGAAMDPDSAVKLRGDPPRVMRLSRKAIGIASACGFALVGGALIYALQPAGRKGAEELYNTDGVAVADNLARAPKDYGQVPKLGPPLPGDLGKPILDAQRRGDVAALPPIGAGPPAAPIDPAVAAADAARQHAEQEREAARGSRLFFGGGSPGSGSAGLVGLPPPAEAPAATPAAAPTPERLIPPMIERFIATDRSYAKSRRTAQPG